MNSVYTFSFKQGNKKHIRKVAASSYINAIEKSCAILEEINDEVDLIGLEDWKEVRDECANYKLYVSDLIELDE